MKTQRAKNSNFNIIDGKFAQKPQGEFVYVST